MKTGDRFHIQWDYVVIGVYRNTHQTVLGVYERLSDAARTFELHESILISASSTYQGVYLVDLHTMHVIKCREFGVPK